MRISTNFENREPLPKGNFGRREVPYSSAMLFIIRCSCIEQKKNVFPSYDSIRVVKSSHSLYISLKNLVSFIAYLHSE